MEPWNRLGTSFSPSKTPLVAHPSSIPCGPRLGPSWAKLGPKWAPDGPDWGPFGNAAWATKKIRNVTMSGGKGSHMSRCELWLFLSGGDKVIMCSGGNTIDSVHQC